MTPEQEKVLEAAGRFVEYWEKREWPGPLNAIEHATVGLEMAEAWRAYRKSLEPPPRYRVKANYEWFDVLDTGPDGLLVARSWRRDRAERIAKLLNENEPLVLKGV